MPVPNPARFWKRVILLSLLALGLAAFVWQRLAMHAADSALNAGPLPARETYVSDSEQLTTISDAEGLRRVRERVNQYLRASGLRTDSPRDLRIACADEGMILRFRVFGDRRPAHYHRPGD